MSRAVQKWFLSIRYDLEGGYWSPIRILTSRTVLSFVVRNEAIHSGCRSFDCAHKWILFHLFCLLMPHVSIIQAENPLILMSFV